MKKKLTKKELAETEKRKKKAAAVYIENQKREPGPVTNVDVARLLGMPENMISEMFGEEARTSARNTTGEGESESE